MKALIFHAKKFGVFITGLAKRPRGITPEAVKKISDQWSDCVAVFITIERGDNEKLVKGLTKEVEKASIDYNTATIVLLPFAHLSNKLAEDVIALSLFDSIEQVLRLKQYKIFRAHFGSDKELLLHIYGHARNARFREFN